MISTRFRIAAFFTFLSFSILLLFSSSVLLVYHEEWIKDEKKEVINAFENFEKNIREEGKKEGFDLQKEIKEFFSVQDKIIGKIWGKNGIVFFESPQFPIFEENTDEFVFDKDQKFLIVKKEISLFEGTAFFAEPIDDYLQQESQLVQISFFLTLFGSLILFFVGYVFAWRILAPIRKISEETDEISIKNLSKRLSLKGHKKDEIRVLSERLNSMFERLYHSAENLKRFTQDASHELKTPLAVIDSTLQLALKTKNTEKIAEALEEIKKMNMLVESLLLLAKSENRKFTKSEKSLLPIKNEIQKIGEKISSQFIEKQISLKINIPENKKLLVEKESFERIIWNLIWNAYKYSPERKVISLSYIKNGIQISNEGNIDQKDLPNLFERFFRGDDSKSCEGTGIGLAIVKSLVEANSGHISVSSEKENIIFTLSFPS